MVAMGIRGVPLIITTVLGILSGSIVVFILLPLWLDFLFFAAFLPCVVEMEGDRQILGKVVVTRLHLDILLGYLLLYQIIMPLTVLTGASAHFNPTWFFSIYGATLLVALFAAFLATREPAVSIELDPV